MTLLIPPRHSAQQASHFARQTAPLSCNLNLQAKEPFIRHHPTCCRMCHMVATRGLTLLIPQRHSGQQVLEFKVRTAPLSCTSILQGEEHTWHLPTCACKFHLVPQRHSAQQAPNITKRTAPLSCKLNLQAKEPFMWHHRTCCFMCHMVAAR